MKQLNAAKITEALQEFVLVGRRDIIGRDGRDINKENSYLNTEVINLGVWATNIGQKISGGVTDSAMLPLVQWLHSRAEGYASLAKTTSYSMSNKLLAKHTKTLLKKLTKLSR